MNLANALGLSRDTPQIYQRDDGDCGLACLAMVAAYHGHQVPLSAFKQKFDTSQRGMTFRNIMDVASKLGMNSRPLQVPIEALDQVQTPAILHWNLNHFVVLKEATGRKFRINDPMKGSRSLTFEEFSKSYTGVVLEFEPNEAFEIRRNVERLRISDLWTKAVGLKRGVLQLLLLSIFLQLLVLINPFFLQLVIDEVLRKSNLDLLAVLALGFGGLVIIAAATEVLRNLAVVYVGSNMSFQIASNLFRHVLGLPLNSLQHRHMGDLVSRFRSIEPIKRLLTEGIIGAAMDGLMAVTTLMMMFVYSVDLATITVGLWSIYFIVRLLLFDKLKDKQSAVIEAEARENTFFMETIQALTTFKLFGREQDRHNQWQNRYAHVINNGASLQRLKAWFGAASQTLTGLELIIIIYVAAKMVAAGDFTVGMIFAYMAYRASFTGKMSALVEQAMELRMVGLHLARISDLVRQEVEVEPGAGEVAPFNVEGAIELRNICYRYSSADPFILDGVSLKINAGESVAIVGPTGCGKSTLVKIIATLIEPTSGSVYVDGNRLTPQLYKEFRRQVGVVMQGDVLLSGTVADNIAFFDPSAEREDIKQAAVMANIFDEVTGMPMRFETQIGDMGNSLSGGQQQRLAIARALFVKPKILLLDEGTSQLDVDTESKINGTISNLGMTRIIVAHRPETIRSADRVFVLQAGKLEEAHGRVKIGGTYITLNNQEPASGGNQRFPPDWEAGSLEPVSNRSV